MITKSALGFGAYELFQLMRDGTPRTRAELASLTGMARSTIGLRIDALRDLGLLIPVSDAASTGGRPSARIAFNPSARLVVAADIGATHTTIAITDLVGSTLAKVHKEGQIGNDPRRVLEELVETTKELLKQIGRLQSELIAVGIGLPGPVEHRSGRPSKPPLMPGWDGYDVPGTIQEHFPVPVLVDNDVNVMALGERATRTPEPENMVFVKVATGIGSGIISGGRLQRGEDGTAGDIGHIAVARGAGIACRCGNTGCLEAIAGGPAIAAEMRRAGLDVETIADVIALARDGDLTAIQGIRQAGRDVGQVLNTIVSVMNPSLISIGGSLSQAGEHLMAGIREVVYARSMPLATQHLTIELSHSGTEAGVAGASILAIEHALSPERLEAISDGTEEAAPLRNQSVAAG
ncbi:MAG: family transcriptional regulator [Microbacteriaceae bacterium]|jgi:predicted NBD/HSP70 family sugar kinase|nr:family transcriptional regulator [Microbacteriaceae bacterium]